MLAKISAPRTNRSLSRERLFQLLDESSPVGWLFGPPGTGKTTLIASYLKQRGLTPIWFQIDSDDRDLSTFFYFLALARTVPSTRIRATTLPVLDADSRQDWIAYSRRFARSLFANLSDGAVLVFDNIQ